MNNYVPYHVHTMLSNCTTNIDSVTKFGQYVGKAQALGMTAFGFSEHGNNYEWLHKKEAVEKAGMKFLYGVEAYVTMHPEEKVRDNYHTILYAKNYDGFLELNRLISGSFERKTTNHFYYVPRIFMDDLEQTSDNILVTSACLGGALNGAPEDEQRFLRFILANRHRCWLEIQHHYVAEQAVYNQKLWDYSKRYKIPLIAGTDSHALNETHAKGRVKLQQGKGVRFDNEEGWDLRFLSYEELREAYKKQNALPEGVYLDAIDETNVFADAIEPFQVDRSIKYPNVFDDPVALWRNEVYQAAENHPYAIKRHGREALFKRLDEELAVFEKCGSSAYMALKYHQHKWEAEHGIQTGYGRGSVTGSMCAYVTGITDVDSMQYGLNFFRFMNPERISLADIDVDYAEADREKAKKYLLDDKMGFANIQTAEIITFNTIATKGAIRDIARADDMSLDEVDKLTSQVDMDGNVPDDVREKYAELFEYVDIVSGTVVSYGSHPCGVLVTDHDIASEIGLCSSSGSAYPITCLNMKELDSLNLVKMDELGLDSNDLINRTCQYAGIERLTPDNMDMEDMAVWQSIREDTTCIFQFESAQATAYLKKFLSPEIVALARARNPHFRMIDWFAFASGLLRPGSASYRDQVAEGTVRDNGCKALNDFLADEAGFCTYQESVMRWLELFCGYSGSEADNVRRCLAEGTMILMSDGTRKPIEQVSSGDQVVSYRDGAMTVATVSKCFDNGMQETYQIDVVGKLSLCATSTHKFMCAEGWKECSQLHEGDSLFAPAKLPSYKDGLRPNQRLSAEEMFVVGALLGDGSIGGERSPAFINSDEELIEYYKHCVDSHFEHGKCEFYDYRTPGKTVEYIHRIIPKAPYGTYMRRWLDAMGICVESADKHIPDSLMHYPTDAKLASLLGGLFSTDGGYLEKSKAIEYSSTSQQLIQDIEILLLRFGIHSYTLRHYVKAYNKYAYRLRIQAPTSMKQFESYILPFVHGKKHAQFLRMLETKSPLSYDYRLPEECTTEIKQAAKTNGVGICSIVGKLCYGGGLTNTKAEKLVERLYCPMTYRVLRSQTRPVVINKIRPAGIKHVYDLEIADTHSYVANGVIVHNCIAKKKGTEELLPEIERRFIEYAPAHYDITTEKAREVIKPFIQTILDASSYSFSANHAKSYAMIGYAIGYLRYHYPLAFIAAALNVYADKEEKTAAIMAYAHRQKIEILPPCWGKSRADYMLDTENNVIYKGLTSIKHLNADIAEQIYGIATEQGSDISFMKVLQLLNDGSSINSRQLDILIQLGFFSQFGNPTELTAINAYFTELNRGALTRVAKDKVEQMRLSGLIEYAATDKGKSGTLKSWMITDMEKLLLLCETHVRAQNLQPPRLSERIKAQQDYLGYIEPMGDAGKGLMYVASDVRQLRSKTTGKPWAYGFTAISLVDGVSREWTIRDGCYLEPLAQGDILRVVPEMRNGVPKYNNAWYLKQHNGRTYYYLCNYQLAVDI